jgi:hypothetical protein
MLRHHTLFQALIKDIPRADFDRLVGACGAGRGVRRLDCWTQLLALLYAQLAGIASLRELVAALASQSDRLQPLGMAPVRRTTLSDANRHRPAALYQAVLDRLLPRLADEFGRAAVRFVRLIDATTLPLPALLCRWACVADHSAGLKLHLVYDPEAQCPTYFALTPARVNDLVATRDMPLEVGATYVFDLASYAFAFWARLATADCRFVTRLKRNTPVRELHHRPVAHPQILSDRMVRLPERLAGSRKNPYPHPVREIVVQADETRSLRLVTNDLEAPAAEIARLYQARWEIELFFRWIKQNLKLKHFLGTNTNAVKLQVMAALIAYVLLRLARRRLSGLVTLQAMARLVRLNLMHRMPLEQLLGRSQNRSQPRPSYAFN